jgi:hypothetical protein
VKSLLGQAGTPDRRLVTHCKRRCGVPLLKPQRWERKPGYKAAGLRGFAHVGKRLQRPHWPGRDDCRAWFRRVREGRHAAKD